MVLSAGGSVIWLVILIILAIAMIAVPLWKAHEMKRNEEPKSFRFNKQDEITFEDEDYIVSHIDNEQQYNLLNVNNYNLKKVPIQKLDADGVLTADLQKLKERQG